jgi:hypothetical protein
MKCFRFPCTARDISVINIGQFGLNLIFNKSENFPVSQLKVAIRSSTTEIKY